MLRRVLLRTDRALTHVEFRDPNTGVIAVYAYKSEPAVDETPHSPLDPKNFRQRYLIIGAGPAGLGIARIFAERNVAFDVVERHEDVGGIWDISNPRSPMYHSAHFISSKSLSGYRDFKFPESAAEYPSHREVLSFIRAYADHYDLRRHIEFRREVAALVPDDGSWTVRFRDGEMRAYGGVVLANGHQWVPNLPRYPGMDEFRGVSLHSVKYRTAELFTGKRVLIVGCGASAVDIANDAATRAERTFFSMRRGHYFVPKHMFGQPTDVWATSGPNLPSKLRQWMFKALLRKLYGDFSRYGLPAPDHQVLERPPIINSAILDNLSHGRLRAKPDVRAIDPTGALFSDGTREELDVIVYCTGYRECWPFLDEKYLHATGGDDLYLHLFHKRFDNLFVAGLLRTNAGGFWLFELQGELIADAILSDGRQRARLREVKTTTREKRSAGIDYQKNEYQSHYLDTPTYLKQVAKLRSRVGWPKR
jgi:hypothetical protein